MAHFLDDVIIDLYNRGGVTATYFDLLGNQLDAAGVDLCDGLLDKAGQHCILAGLYCKYIANYFHQDAFSYTNVDIEGYTLIRDNWPDEAPELTMEAILIAMLGANASEVMYFVGLVDAYRQSVWNQPFNQDFFASLARGFEQWG